MAHTNGALRQIRGMLEDLIDSKQPVPGGVWQDYESLMAIKSITEEAINPTKEVKA